jgi:Predicted membrane protein (DUF2254)
MPFRPKGPVRSGDRTTGPRCPDPDGVLRLMFPMPTWSDYLTLAFDEIRQYGVGSLQVIRRLRAALNAIADSVDEDRREIVRRHLRHLDDVVGHSAHNVEDRIVALQEDRQGLGLSRKPDDLIERPMARSGSALDQHRRRNTLGIPLPLPPRQ